jgi:NAD(P)-dependent dehydrogenase (short-subunit alcohol dehydrogenase family)
MKVFITGGSSGIGLGLVKFYLRQGAQVAALSRSIRPEMFPLEDRHLLTCYLADVCDKEAVNLAIIQFWQLGSRGIDLVIANAGISMELKSQVPDWERAELVIDTSLKGTLYTFAPAIKLYREHGLPQERRMHLVGVSSVAGTLGLPGTSAYCAAKAAVRTLCESFAIDLPSLGIDVTCLAPGFIDTPLTQKNHHPMPFLMPLEKSIFLMVKAIEKKKTFYLFPWPMLIFYRVMTFLPRAWYVKIMHLGPFNYSLKE